MVVYRAGEQVRAWRGSTGAVCNSYGSELTALEKGVRWQEEEAILWSTSALVAECRSLVEALQAGGVERN